MGGAVCRNIGETTKCPSKKLVQEQGAKLRHGEVRLGQSIEGAHTQHTSIARPAVINHPITHLAAGMKVPVSKALKNRFGIGVHPVDGALLLSVNVLEGVLSAGIENSWTSSEEIQHMLSSFEIASPEQARESFKLANQVLSTIQRKVREHNEPEYKKLAAHNFLPVGTSVGALAGDWGTVLEASSYSEETMSEFDVPASGLIAGESGLCVMQSEINGEPNEELKINIAQFIQFCCSLSQHASTIDMVLDETVKWVAIGDVAEIGEKEEAVLMEIAEDKDSFYKALLSYLGDGFEEDMFISYTALADYYISYKQAKAISLKLKPFTKKNVKSFLQKIKRIDSTPTWLITGTEILLNSCDWSIDTNALLKWTGHLPYEFTKPYGFGFPIEPHLYESLHETLMHGEEIISMCVPYSEDTVRVLTNLDLGETLLVFVNEMLYPSAVA